jgi:hypothetical protein
LDITKDIVRELREINPTLTWRPVPFNEKRLITERINARLIDEGSFLDLLKLTRPHQVLMMQADIPKIEIELVGWRMSRAIGKLKHAAGKLLLHGF